MEQEKIFYDKLNDCLEQVRRNGREKFAGFFNEFEAAQAAAYLRTRAANTVCFFGGHEQAERLMLGIGPDEPPKTSAFPLCAIRYDFPREESVRHSDVLGSLLGLGIVRGTVGDIVVQEGSVTVFVLESVSALCLSLEKIGRCGVKARKLCSIPDLPVKSVVPGNGTVASLRLDCVVALLAGCSRGQAEERIALGQVFINAICVEKPARTVDEGDQITIRRCGKFRILDAGRRTKKDRVVVGYEKFN